VICIWQWQSESSDRTNEHVNKSPQKTFRPAAGTRGKSNYAGRGRNPSRYNQGKPNDSNFNGAKNMDFVPIYPNYCEY